MIGIYVIINSINNKKYIGQSVNIERRFKEHHYRPFKLDSKMANSPLYKAIRKYGIDNFIFLVLEECKKKDLNKREKYWINYFETNDKQFGYNLTKGGNTSKPLVLNEKEVKEIKALLETTNITQDDIAKKFNITQRTVSYINDGTLWMDEKENYPLRIFESRRKRYYCQYCGREVSRGNDTCSKCAMKKRRIIKRPSREDLKDLIRNMSFIHIGKMYGVSDNSIRKWCREYNLPYHSLEIKNISDKDWVNI